MVPLGASGKAWAEFVPPRQPPSPGAQTASIPSSGALTAPCGTSGGMVPPGADGKAWVEFVPPLRPLPPGKLTGSIVSSGAPTTPCGTSGGTAPSGADGRAWVACSPPRQPPSPGARTASIPSSGVLTVQCGTSGGAKTWYLREIRAGQGRGLPGASVTPDPRQFPRGGQHGHRRDPQAHIEELLDAYNAQDLDRAPLLYAEDCQYVNRAYGRDRGEGAKRPTREHRRLLGSLPD